MVSGGDRWWAPVADRRGSRDDDDRPAQRGPGRAGGPRRGPGGPRPGGRRDDRRPPGRPWSPPHGQGPERPQRPERDPGGFRDERDARDMRDPRDGRDSRDPRRDEQGRPGGHRRGFGLGDGSRPSRPTDRPWDAPRRQPRAGGSRPPGPPPPDERSRRPMGGPPMDRRTPMDRPPIDRRPPGRYRDAPPEGGPMADGPRPPRPFTPGRPRPWEDADRSRQRPGRPPSGPWPDRAAQGRSYRPAPAAVETLELAEDEELVAGRRPVEEAFVARREAKRLLVVPQRRLALEKLVLHATSLRIPVVEVEGGSLTAIAGFDGHQGVALVVAPRQWAGLDDILAAAAARGEPPLVLVLDSLEDPQNLGTLLRSAEASGVHGAIFPTRRQAPLTPAAVKASAGAVEHLRLAPCRRPARVARGPACAGPADRRRRRRCAAVRARVRPARPDRDRRRQ